jgi:tRNA1Val (adenine37-N6)-methyltransferase
MGQLTEDTFFNGNIRVKQHAGGYRFSIDPVILAGHLTPDESARLVDLGTGCGIIPLILAYRFPSIHITGLEIQESLAELATTNVRDNRLQSRVAIVCRDIKTVKNEMAAGQVDLVACNPPFRKANSGRINPHPERAIARHEIQVSLTDIMTAAAHLLRVAGEFAVIYPATRLTDLLGAMRAARLEPKFLRLVHSRKQTEAKLIVVRGNKNGRPGITVAPPLTIYDDTGDYAPETKKLFLS